VYRVVINEMGRSRVVWRGFPISVAALMVYARLVSLIHPLSTVVVSHNPSPSTSVIDADFVRGTRGVV